MNIENIVEYINKTPGNTNPSVVVSMVQSILNNSIDQSGYCIVWDGEVSNRDKITIEGITGDEPGEDADFALNFYKVSDSVFSPNQLVNSYFSYDTPSNEFIITEELVVNLENITIVYGGDALPVVTAYAGEYYLEGVSVIVPSNGTYFMALSDKNNLIIHRTGCLYRTNLK